MAKSEEIRIIKSVLRHNTHLAPDFKLALEYRLKELNG